MYSNRVRYTAVSAVVAAGVAVTSSVSPVALADSTPAGIASPAAAPVLSASIDPALAIGPLPQSLTDMASQMAASVAGGVSGAMAARALQRKSVSTGLAGVPRGSGDSQFDAPPT